MAGVVVEDEIKRARGGGVLCGLPMLENKTQLHYGSAWGVCRPEMLDTLGSIGAGTACRVEQLNTLISVCKYPSAAE